jgi:hypothetical protein
MNGFKVQGNVNESESARAECVLVEIALPGGAWCTVIGTSAGPVRVVLSDGRYVLGGIDVHVRKSPSPFRGGIIVGAENPTDLFEQGVTPWPIPKCVRCGHDKFDGRQCAQCKVWY